MKCIPFLLFAVILYVGSFHIACDNVGMPQSNVLPLSNFEQIVLRAPVHLHLKQEPSFKVELVADTFWLDRIEVEVVGNVLEVNFSPDTTGAGINDTAPIYDVDLFVELPDLKQIEVLTAAKIETENRFILSDLGIDASGAARVDFEGEAQTISLDISGAALFDMNIEVDSLDTEIRGAGKLELEGLAASHTVDISGAGEIEAFDFEVNDYLIDFVGAGNCEVMAQDNLDVTIVGAGVVFYKGTPIITQNISGLGGLVDAN